MDVNFPRAECVLDFYHAAEHLNDLAKALYPGEEGQAAEVAGQWCHTLKHRGGAALLAVLDAFGFRCLLRKAIANVQVAEGRKTNKLLDKILPKQPHDVAITKGRL